MITTHFLKMFLGLMVMALVGLFGLIYSGVLATPEVGDRFTAGLVVIEDFITGKSPTQKQAQTTSASQPQAPSQVHTTTKTTVGSKKSVKKVQ
jgi:hypothetical protein